MKTFDNHILICHYKRSRFGILLLLANFVYQKSTNTEEQTATITAIEFNILLFQC